VAHRDHLGISPDRVGGMGHAVTERASDRAGLSGEPPEDVVVQHEAVRGHEDTHRTR
jgi:hypothetical protein